MMTKLLRYDLGGHREKDEKGVQNTVIRGAALPMFAFGTPGIDLWTQEDKKNNRYSYKKIVKVGRAVVVYCLHRWQVGTTNLDYGDQIHNMEFKSDK